MLTSLLLAALVEAYLELAYLLFSFVSESQMTKVHSFPVFAGMTISLVRSCYGLESVGGSTLLGVVCLWQFGRVGYARIPDGREDPSLSQPLQE